MQKATNAAKNLYERKAFTGHSVCRCIFVGVENLGKRTKVLHECQANASIIEAGQTLSEYTTKEHFDLLSSSGRRSLSPHRALHPQKQTYSQENFKDYSCFFSLTMMYTSFV